ncbi:MAG: hypothetical protein JNL03_09495 [Prolixibacteraceae bacterium]|nr:hypothetical protein [Prolixibacteraceae bacterium]
MKSKAPCVFFSEGQTNPLALNYLFSKKKSPFFVQSGLMVDFRAIFPGLPCTEPGCQELKAAPNPSAAAETKANDNDFYKKTKYAPNTLCCR